MLVTHIPYKQTISLFLELWVVQIQDWFMMLHCASCVVEFKKPLLFKQMFLFPCSLFDIGPCVKCVMSGPRRQ